MITREQKAKLIAETAHYGQLRKYTNEPYIHHPGRVAELVRSVPHTEDMLCACWLHDTIEDTGVEAKFIYSQFGDVVGDLVMDLIDISSPEDGNRALRKAIDRGHIAYATPEAKTIKLADLIDNSKSIIEHDPKFAKVYMAEKKLLLEVLQEGDKTLYAMAKQIVEDYYAIR